MDRIDSGERLVDKSTAAHTLGVSKRTVDRLLAKGVFSRVKILGAIRIKVSEIQALIAKGGLR